MTDLTTKGDLNARLRALGPDPRADSPDPARDLARALLVGAQRNWTVFQASIRPGMPKDTNAGSLACAQFAAVHGLEYLRGRNPAVAEGIAREIIGAWGNGPYLARLLAEDARALGLDPETVPALTAELLALAAADPAPTLAQHADKAEADARGMAELIRRGGLTVRAAAIDAERGDLRAAGELLREIADPAGFPAWDGAKTGREWLAGALHAAPEPEPDPEPEPAIAADEPLAARREPAPTEALEMAPELDAGRADAADTLTMTAVAR